MSGSVKIPKERVLEPLSDAVCLLAGKPVMAANCLEREELFQVSDSLNPPVV